MAKRLILGPVLIAALAGIYLLDVDVFGRALASRILLWTIALGAFHEYAVLVGKRLDLGPGFFLYGGVAILAVVTPALLAGTPVSGAMVVLAAVVGGGIRLLGMAPVRSAGLALPEAAALAGGIAYVAGLLAFLDRILVVSVGAAFAVLAVSKSSDIFGYLVGKPLGRKRIAPALSPKKSWEGTIAGILGAAGVAALCHGVFDRPRALAALIGALIGAASLLGDLAESGLKRWAGAKDSSALLPEFGGFLDMVDGVLVAAPVAVVCLYGT